MAALALVISSFVLLIEAILVADGRLYNNYNVFAPLSSCGGSTPWKCPYTALRVPFGCSEMSIKTAAECRTAAEMLGYFGTLHQESGDDRPFGCSVGKGPMDKSLNSKWEHIYFNRGPVGHLPIRQYRSICHNRVEIEGPIGVERDFLWQGGRRELGLVKNVHNGQNRCCQECWAMYPGTQLFEYHSGPSQIYDTLYFNDVCRCLYKDPGQILKTTQVGSRQSTGFCAKEIILDLTTCTPGDNVGGAEQFIQWEQYIPYGTCKEVCKHLYPASIGITESTTQEYPHLSGNKKKCWCEFGPTPEIVQDDRYQTCIFNFKRQS